MRCAIRELIKIWRVFGFVTALLIPASTAAAVQILKTHGPVHYTIGVVDPLKPLTKNTKLQPTMCISASNGGYVDLRFVESGSLLRVTGGASVTLQSDGLELWREVQAWRINLALHKGRILAVPMFADENSQFSIAADRRGVGDFKSCTASGSGTAFSFSSDGECKALTGVVSTGIACGNGPSHIFYHVYPPNHRLAKHLNKFKDEGNKPEADQSALETEVDDLRKNSLTLL